MTFASDCRAAFQPFSVGPRNCAGLNLAWAEIRFILAALVLNFKLDPPLDQNILVWEAQKSLEYLGAAISSCPNLTKRS